MHEREAVPFECRGHLQRARLDARHGASGERHPFLVADAAAHRCAHVALERLHCARRVATEDAVKRLRIEPGKIAISTMHLAKGLEFRAVAVIACDDEVIPSQERIDAIADNADLEEVYNTERHLLNVACTRARDRLWVSGVEPASEFLSDLEATTVENVVGTQAP